jgi:hypothetical protein
MYRFINILVAAVIACGLWKFAEYFGEDPVKMMLIYICVMISDAIHIARNK